MSTARSSSNAALISLETAAASARSGFACMFASSDEYEHALIAERRAQGRYAGPTSRWPTVMFVACALLLVVAGMLAGL